MAVGRDMDMDGVLHMYRLVQVGRATRRDHDHHPGPYILTLTRLSTPSTLPTATLSDLNASFKTVLFLFCSQNVLRPFWSLPTSPILVLQHRPILKC